MKKLNLLKPLLIAAVLSMCSPAPAYDLDEILKGMDRRETIVIEVPASNITYIAESTIGASTTNALWVCSKVITSSSGGTNTTIITVMPTLQIPGSNGVNLATFNYPND